MSLFIIKGAITSMITGYQPEEKMSILPGRYKY